MVGGQRSELTTDYRIPFGFFASAGFGEPASPPLPRLPFSSLVSRLAAPGSRHSSLSSRLSLYLISIFSRLATSVNRASSAFM